MAAAKPQLRGLLHAKTKFHIPIALTLSILAGVAWKYGIMEPKRQRYAEFYRTYDAEKSFERMKNAGVFQSCGPDD